MTDSEHNAPKDGAPDETGQPSALDWAQRNDMSAAVMAELRALSRRRQKRRFVGVSLAFATAAAVWVGVLWFRPVEPSGHTAPALSNSLTVVQPERRTLPDGSVVDLKDGAQLELAFSTTVRLVRLEHGTAIFKVAHNAERPFVVVANGVSVRAGGTEFCVDLMTDAVDVLVTEGRVAVADKPQDILSDATQAGPRQASVGAGERVMVGMTPRAQQLSLNVEPIGQSDWEAKLSWRLPKLDFLRTPLGEVLAMFNRYNDRKMVLRDPALADLKVSGTLRADKIEALLDVLHQSFDLTVENSGQGDIVIGR